MEVETPRTGIPGVGSQGEGGGDILAGYRDRIMRGVTFSDISKTDIDSGDYYADSPRRIYPSREYGHIPVLGLRDVRRGMDAGSSLESFPRSRGVTHGNTEKRFRLPRIVVRDVVGRELDTFTALQEAIYRAQWNVKTSCESLTPREWRLPKAPLPSRPDYSRQGPKVAKSSTEQHRLPRASRTVPPGSVVEIGVEDVSYVAETLRHLPKLETFKNLFHGASGSHDRVYFHIVARLLLHQKIYPADDKREALYEFPGFCTGCRRAGFCYSCSKGGGNFHVHHDQPMKTGGGFTYWKRDLPDNPDSSKHPKHWGVKIPESELKLLLDSDKTMSEAAKGALRQRLVSQYPWLQEVSLEDTSIDRMKELGLVMTQAEMQRREDTDAVDTGNYGPGMMYGEDSNYDLLGYSRMEKFLQARDAARKKYTIKLKKPVSVPVAKMEEEDRKVSLERQDTGRQTIERQGTERRSRLDGERLGGWESDSMYDTTFVGDSDRDDDDKENTDADSRKTKLYKAPKFFKLRKRQQRTTVSRSPFSSNREYNIPKGRPIDIKKSDKSVTKFMEFNRSGSDWKEPKKFELSQISRKNTKFWHPKSGRGDGKEKGRSEADQDEAYRSAMARRRKELERSLSPDSGLDSEAVTERQPPKATMVIMDLHINNTRFFPLVHNLSNFRSASVPKEDKAVPLVSYSKYRHSSLPNVTDKSQYLAQKSVRQNLLRRSFRSDGFRKRESVKESTIDTYRDATSLHTTETDQELSGLGHDQQYDSGKEASISESPRDHLSPDTSVKKKRSPIVKKTRSPIQFTKPRSSPEVTPEPKVEETLVDDVSPEPPSRERSMTPPPEEQYVPDISLPDLPQYKKEQKEHKKSKVQKFFVEAPPELKTPPKKRKSPPKVRKLPKVHYKRKSKPAEAPVTTETLQDVSDPLDFLAKYCIINPNRLPFYEIIFENMVGDQTPRYERQQPTSEQVVSPEREVTEVKGKGKHKKSGKKSEDEISEHELKLARDMLLINHRHVITDKIGLSPPEEYREKIMYTLDNLQDKAATLEKQLTELDVRRISALAEGTRQLFPDVCAHDYVPPDKKKGKKGKKSKKEVKDTVEVATPRRRGEPVPDYVIVDRLTDAQLTTLSDEPEVRQLNLERERTQEKMKDVDNRIQQLEGEKLLFDVLCMDAFFSDQTENQRPSHFRRQQSQLYNKLHPDPDYEMDLDTVEEALQQINNHLLTDQEFKYLYFILNLPGRSRINFRLFSVIAALSEKVTQMDPVIRDLLNKFDYNALDVKMEKCKDLFSLLEDDKQVTPKGGAPASNLAVELNAGGLKPEHTSYVLSKFNREGKGVFDFMDFVTYIPLFIEIHQRIIEDPLSEEHDL